MSLIQKTIQSRLSGVQFTWKKMSRSNKKCWTETNIIYTRNFLQFIQTVYVYKVQFIDEASINLSSCDHYYGSAECGSCAVDISTHKQGDNYTLFCLVGLNNKCFNSVQLTPTTGNDFINFVHQAFNARANNGMAIIEPGVIIVTDCASVHSGYVQDILKPYLNEHHITHIYLAKFSLDMTPAKPYLGKLKKILQQSYFQGVADYSLETAVLSTAELITHEDVYQFFKNVSLNYFNL